MLRIMNYATPESLDEAYALLTKNKKNMILGGMIWLKMEDIQIPTTIDLSKLGLDQIEEDDAEFKIGAMVTLRQLETHESFNKATCHVFRDAVKDIVGVQLRNLATIGGSVYSRFSFSDVICSLLCLECDVQTHAHGRISLEEFISLPYEKDIVEYIYVKKTNLPSAFVSVRKSATDLSVLNASCTKYADHYRFCFGARPAIAKVYNCDLDHIDLDVYCADNMRGSKEYREKLVEGLTQKLLRKVESYVG